MPDKTRKSLGRGLDSILQSPETDITSRDISGDFSAIAREFLHEDIPHVHSVEIERY